MNAEPLVWTLLLLSLAAVLLALPFLPAWNEWRRPSDREAMPVARGSIKPARLLTVRLPNGAHFDQLQAERIVLGEGCAEPQGPTVALQRWQPPPDARPWGVKGWQIAHDLHIPPGHLVPCSLVVRGRLNVEGPSRVEGDVKCRGDLRLGQGCQVLGNLFSESDILLASHCEVGGVVMAEGRLQLSPHVVIGQPRLPVSVCADVIDAQGPVQVHGSLLARVQGQVRNGQTTSAEHR